MPVSPPQQTAYMSPTHSLSATELAGWSTGAPPGVTLPPATAADDVKTASADSR